MEKKDYKRLMEKSLGLIATKYARFKKGCRVEEQQKRQGIGFRGEGRGKTRIKTTG